MTKPYPLVIADGGRSDSPGLYDESSDCCVRALAIATFIPYSIVHNELKHAGRRTKRGFDLNTYLARRRSFMGVRYTHVTFRRKTVLSDVFQLFPRHTVLVDLPDHTFAICDGVAYDLIRLSNDEPVAGVWLF